MHYHYLIHQNATVITNYIIYLSALTTLTYKTGQQLKFDNTNSIIIG